MKKKKAETKIDTRNIAALKDRVKALVNVPARRFNDAVCDIIDAGGYSVAVLLDTLPELPVALQQQAVRKIEDFFYFHPENGVKLFSRLKKALEKVDQSCRPGILSAMADISEKADDRDFTVSDLGEYALAVLESDADLGRQSKAIEVAVKALEYGCIPFIIKIMKKATTELDNFQNYQFIETSLLALKRLGGEPIIRLLINPGSDSASRQLRLEWRGMKDVLLSEAFSVLRTLDADFAQMMLKVVDLSDFNLPFVAMINEGVSHDDKWVRQAAVASMKKASEALSPEVLSRMLNDSASEVRMMAATSLGGFSAEQTGSLLEELAGRQGEAREIRLNALYALFAQKNLPALKNLAAQPDDMQIAANALGLSVLLMPHDEGLATILNVFGLSRAETVGDLSHYLMELSDPEDIGKLIKAHSGGNETCRERLIEFIKQFAARKAGPRLDAAIGKLSENEQKALKALTLVA